MKTYAVLCAILIFSVGFAAINTLQLTGAFTSGCIQTQLNGRSGYVTEVYAFTGDNHYSFDRTWFRDSACSDSLGQIDSESGTITIGRPNTNQGFNPSGTFEVQYTNQNSTDKGLAWVSADGTKLRVARGMGSMQNTMLGLFQFTRTP